MCLPNKIKLTSRTVRYFTRLESMKLYNSHILNILIQTLLSLSRVSIYHVLLDDVILPCEHAPHKRCFLVRITAYTRDFFVYLDESCCLLPEIIKFFRFPLIH